MVTQDEFRRISYVVKNKLSWTEEKIVDFYETSWFMRHKIPTVQETVDYLNKYHEKLGHTEGKTKQPKRVRYTAINYHLQRGPVIKALEKRGIPYLQHTQEELTPEQKAAALTVCNFADERSTAQKLDQLGISSVQYYAWLRDPNFNNFVQELTEQNAKHIKPAAINELAKKVNAGEWGAVKFYLETTGALLQDDSLKSEQLLTFLIEILQEEIKDPAILTRIAQRIKLAAQNRTLEVVSEPSREIESYVLSDNVVDERDVVAAKKQLGI